MDFKKFIVTDKKAADAAFLLYGITGTVGDKLARKIDGGIECQTKGFLELIGKVASGLGRRGGVGGGVPRTADHARKLVDNGTSEFIFLIITHGFCLALLAFLTGRFNRSLLPVCYDYTARCVR